MKSEEYVKLSENRVVAPLTGAWIEIDFGKYWGAACLVAPLTGAWIEMVAPSAALLEALCRSPHGSVD